MPMATALSRIGRFEFFAILAPGLCLVAIVTLFITACVSGTTQDMGQAVRELSDQISSHWPLSVTLFFFAYLVGSVLRAVPVAFSDVICGRVIRQMIPKKWKWDEALFRERFPYRPMLEMQLADLQQNGLLEKASVPPKGTAHTTFNLWKLMLCDRSPASFDYTQELEARVRLFSGMIWASVLSGVLGLLGIMFSSRMTGVFHPSWFALMTGVAAVSFFFAALLGWRLRFVRLVEVEAVFFGILNLQLKSATH